MGNVHLPFFLSDPSPIFGYACRSLLTYSGIRTSDIYFVGLLLQLEFKCRFAQIMQMPAAQPKQEL